MNKESRKKVKACARTSRTSALCLPTSWYQQDTFTA